MSEKMWRVVMIKEVEEAVVVRYRHIDIVMPRDASIRMLMDMFEMLDREDIIHTEDDEYSVMSVFPIPKTIICIKKKTSKEED